MVVNKAEEKTIDFRHITLDDKEKYEKFLFDGVLRGCEFSFANLYLWGRQKISFSPEGVLIFSQFDRRTVYPFPLGAEDLRAAIDKIIADSVTRGIPCRISGVLPSQKELLEQLYPGMFRFHSDEDSFDYVYAIDDLAELSGKKYHGKRNHLNRFMEDHPDCKVVSMSNDNAYMAAEMVERWYETKLAENPNADFHMEKSAIKKALRDFQELGLLGLLLLDRGEVLAFTIGSFLRHDTVDVHFEKARADVNGAYTAINYEFARYVREKFPSVRFIDREEDMGIEGLRRAKRSYHPSYMVEKYWACLLEEGYEY